MLVLPNRTLSVPVRLSLRKEHKMLSMSLGGVYCTCDVSIRSLCSEWGAADMFIFIFLDAESFCALLRW